MPCDLSFVRNTSPTKMTVARVFSKKFWLIVNLFCASMARSQSQLTKNVIGSVNTALSALSGRAPAVSGWFTTAVGDAPFKIHLNSKTS